MGVHMGVEVRSSHWVSSFIVLQDFDKQALSQNQYLIGSDRQADLANPGVLPVSAFPVTGLQVCIATSGSLSEEDQTHILMLFKHVLS